MATIWGTLFSDKLVIGGGTSVDFSTIADTAIRDIEIIDLEEHNVNGPSTIRLSATPATAPPRCSTRTCECSSSAEI